MQSKRDQVQAHLFVMGRLASGMLRADPDAPESPSGRTNRGAAIGAIVAIIVCAGAFVFGMFKPGGNEAWRTSGGLVVDKQTGSSYMYLDGRLRPVRNYTSVRLLAGADVSATAVGTSSLAGTPHGSPIGIPEAPDAIPRAADLATTPWRVCTALVPPASSRAKVTPSTALAIGVSESADTMRFDAKEALLVAAPSSELYLVWQGSRLRLDERSDAVKALGYATATPRMVSAAFLDALPAGPDLAPPDVPDRGRPGPSLGGSDTRIGQIFRVEVPGAGPRYHLLAREGLVPLTATEAALLLGDPRTRTEAYKGASVTVPTLEADVLARSLAPSKESSQATDASRLPSSPPRLVDVPGLSPVCANVDGSDGTTRASVSVVPADSIRQTVQAPPPDTQPACLKTDRISVPPDGGALVQALSASGAMLGDTTYLITDGGIKYRLSSAKTKESLGYGQVKPVLLPSMMLSMIPSGPDLSAEAATTGVRRTSPFPC